MWNTHPPIRMIYCDRLMSRVAVSLMLIGLVAAGCATKKNPALTCSNGTCSDPQFPYCDVDGAIGGSPNTCLAATCSPGEFIACDQDNEIVCNASGSNYEATSCPTGCSVDTNGCKPCLANTTTCTNGMLNVCDASGMSHPQQCAAGCVDGSSPHCAYIAPRYVPNACDSPATQASLTITNSASLDPNLDTNCTGGVVDQTGGPSICIVRYGTIDITDGVTLSVHNTPEATGRTVAFVADDRLSIEGTLDVSAHGALSGPGGGVVHSGGSTVIPTDTAGGGAGGATPGAAGGNGSGDGSAANGGAAVPDPALLAALIGGAAAYQFDDGSELIGGGGGGGGVTLVACRGVVDISGTINAGGGGGTGGTGTFLRMGHGGGAGGYIVLQGMNVLVTGEIFANGAGGGAGAQPGGTSGLAGSDGSLSDTVRASGGAPQAGEGAGGTGGIEGATPSIGRKNTATGTYPGGGGGSVGFLQTYTPDGIDPTLTPAHVSPAFRPNGTAQTR